MSKRNVSAPPTPWQIDIDIYLQPEGSNPPFEWKTCLPINSANEIQFSNNGRHGFLINFNLWDPHNTGYKFPDDVEEAMYSKKNSSCPPPKGQWPQFQAEEVKPGNMTLVVRNRNESGHSGKFAFGLRVTKTNSAPYLMLDPGGDNQNGNFFVRFD